MSTSRQARSRCWFGARVRSAENALRCPLPRVGREEQYPYYALDLRYQAAPRAARGLHAAGRRLGFERFVFVQPSAYGSITPACSTPWPRWAPSWRRGIVHLDETKQTTRRSQVAGTGRCAACASMCRRYASPRRRFADHLGPKIVRTARHLRELAGTSTSACPAG